MNKDHLVCREWLIAALSIFNDRKNGNEYFLRGIETAKEIIKTAPIADCIPTRGVTNNVNDNIYINRRPCAAYDGGNKRGNCAVD